MRVLKASVLGIAGLVMLAGCVQTPEGRLRLIAVNTGFSTEEIEIKASPLGEVDSTGVSLLDQLAERGFVFVRLSIENKSPSTVLYNTSHTFLFAGVLDYKKPLDLTDLYLLIREEGAEPQTLSTLSGLKRFIFDGTTRIKPGERVERLLVFRPLAMESANTRAVLGLNQLYIGSDAMDVRLLFRVE